MASDPLGLGEGDAEGILAVCERWLWALLESDMAERELARQWGCCAQNMWPEPMRDPERRGQGPRAERAAGVGTQARQRSSIGWAHEYGGLPTGVAAVEQMHCIRRGARAQEERPPAVLGLSGRGWHLPLVPLQSVCWSGVAGARGQLSRVVLGCSWPALGQPVRCGSVEPAGAPSASASGLAAPGWALGPPAPLHQSSVG